MLAAPGLIPALLAAGNTDQRIETSLDAAGKVLAPRRSEGYFR